MTHITSYSISEKELYQLFIQNGFEIINQGKEETFLKKDFDGEFAPTTYAQIVVKKIRDIFS